MLQPVPARFFFRVLEAPLGLGAVLAGGLSFAVALGNLGHGWLWLGLLFAGPLLTVFGVLGLIHAFTGGLPEWIVGPDDDERSGSDVPAA
jgi:hypothetical protein